jgi:hypothetical protein
MICIIRLHTAATPGIARVAGGHGDGGGPANERGATATMTGSTFTANSAGLSGGGIDNAGTATVSDSNFRRNIAGSGNGGLNNEPSGLLTQFDNQLINDLPPDIFPWRKMSSRDPAFLDGGVTVAWSATSSSRW